MTACVDLSRCIGCEECVAICPTGALTIECGRLRVTENLCLSCGACARECGMDAIRMETVRLGGTEVKEAKNIWVAAQVEDGELLPVTFELLGAAAPIAKKANEKLCAVLIAGETGELPNKLFAAGADVVYVVTGEEFAEYNNEIYTNAFCELVREYAPNAVLFPATTDGRDFAPRVAARLRTGLCADCTSLGLTDDGLIAWVRPALGGNILATIVCPEARPQMGTVRPKIFPRPEMDESRSGEIVPFVPQNKIVPRTHVTESCALAQEGMLKLEDAEVVVSGGRGMGTQEQFKELYQLAALFEKGTVGGSRAVVDDRWLNHSFQVGQSGKNVTPKGYLAFGISGALQHVCGMKDSAFIAAINKDSSAEIFKVANFGVVGDVHVILPKLIERIKKYKEE